MPVQQPSYRVARPEDVEREALNWTDGMLECRTYGHHWLPQRAVWNAEYLYYHLNQICPRCRCERTMDMNRHGHLLSTPVINYTEGYLSGSGRIVGDGRDVLRLAAVTRTFPLEKISGKRAKDTLPTSRIAREALDHERDVG